MGLKDDFAMGSAIVAGLGGGGLIVFGLSGFLGKLWADKALAEVKNKYIQANIELQNKVDSEANI